MRRFFSVLFRLLATVLVAGGCLLGVALWQAARDLPPPACRWLENRLSQGPVSVLFDRAAFSLSRGIELRRVRLYPKRRLGAPLFETDRIQLRGRVYRSRQPAAWIDSVTFQGLVIDPFLAWPVSSQGLTLQDWTALFDPANPAGALFARPVAITIEDSTIFGIATERVTFALRSQRDRLFIDNARVDVQTPRFRERVDGEAAFDFQARRLQVNLGGTLTPDVIERLCLFLDGGDVVEVFRDFGDYRAPLNVHGSMGLQLAAAGRDEPASLDMRVTVDGAGLRFRGIPLTRLQLSLQWLRENGQRKLTLAPIVAQTSDGQADLAIAYFPQRHETDFTFSSTLPGPTLLQALRAAPGVVSSNLHVHTVPLVSASGTLAGRLASRASRIDGRLVCDDLTLYPVRLRHARADFQIHGTNRIELTDVAANCYGGSLTGRATVVRSPTGGLARIDLELGAENVGLAELLADHGAKSSIEGQVSVQTRLSLPGSTQLLHQATGAGRVTVRDGTILRVPVFAGLTDFLGRNIPGVDLLLMQSDAQLPFTITNGVATIRDFRVEGNLFSLTANGTCRLDAPGYPLDGVTQLRFFKQKTLAGMLARLITLPVSKMMQFRISGPVMKPEWNYFGIVEQIMDSIRGRPETDGGGEPDAMTREP